MAFDLLWQGRCSLVKVFMTDAISSIRTLDPVEGAVG